ncbi:fatty-acyl-CoA synthase [Variovorax boronicumulans]|uniref:Fatty-acyl-CoA synthase n=1 Tax=Variovorax boronicumulans TaxID=436515 RepID=A0AAW8DTE0_9BURK|nr:AMP-binding protein [Variovorax boronicumulans]MDP9877432.1 fatty-acyl-CoA synthase [Variovorax boronicumulans]MDP9922717.1 fatty-acyl-CoA synthase [Variovorax boronicumulans]
MDMLTIASQDDIARIERVPLAQRLPWRSVGALLEAAASAHPDATAWIYLPHPGEPSFEPASRQSHAEFNATLRRAAALWRRLAAQHGRATPVVACLLHHGPQAHHATWSAECAGVALPVNPTLETEHIASLLRAADAHVLVASRADAQIWAKVPGLLELVPGLRAVVAVRDEPWAPAQPAGPMRVPLLDWDEALAREDADVPLDATAPDDPRQLCAWFHTGGTTGQPKLAAQHHLGQVFDNAVSAAMYGLRPGHLVLGAMPLFHVAGLTLTGLAPLSAGAAVLLVGGGWRNKALYPRIWQLLAQHRVTHVSTVPTVLSSLLDVPVDADISSLELVWCGAAPLPRATLTRFEAHAGVPVIEGYGCTELHCVATQNPLHGSRKPGSIGLRLPYTRLRVALPDTPARDCPPGEVGHLLFQGPNVFGGYLGIPSGQQPLDAEGWYDSGDLGWQDSDGFVWLIGRARDLIIRGGHNIDPAPVEEALLRHPAVEAAAVVARPDAHAGEIPVAYVRLRRGEAFDAEALQAHLRRQTIERAAVPDWIEPLPELPVTAVGKLARNRLRARAADRAVRALLGAAGIAVRDVSARDEGRGVQVEVELESPQDQADVQALLGRLSLQVRVH